MWECFRLSDKVMLEDEYAHLLVPEILCGETN